MRRRTFIQWIGGAAAFTPLLAHAQQVPRPARVGILVLSEADGQSLVGLLGSSLREAGYTEGQNLHFDVRSADGKVAQLAGLAAELVRLNVDVIVAAFTPCALAAKQAT